MANGSPSLQSRFSSLYVYSLEYFFRCERNSFCFDSNAVLGVASLHSLLYPSFTSRLLAARIVWFPSFPSVSSFYHFITQIQILHNSHINFKMTSNSQDDPTSGCYVVFFWVLSRMLEPSQEDRVHRDMWSSNMAWFHATRSTRLQSLSSFATPRHD